MNWFDRNFKNYKFQKPNIQYCGHWTLNLLSLQICFLYILLQKIKPRCIKNDSSAPLYVDAPIIQVSQGLARNSLSDLFLAPFDFFYFQFVVVVCLLWNMSQNMMTHDYSLNLILLTPLFLPLFITLNFTSINYIGHLKTWILYLTLWIVANIQVFANVFFSAWIMKSANRLILFYILNPKKIWIKLLLALTINSVKQL